MTWALLPCCVCAVFSCFLRYRLAGLTRWAVETGECIWVVWIVKGISFTFSVPQGLTRWIWAIKRIYITLLTTSYCCRCSLSLLLVYSLSLLLCLRLPDPIEGLPKMSALTAIRRDIGRQKTYEWAKSVEWYESWILSADTCTPEIHCSFVHPIFNIRHW